MLRTILLSAAMVAGVGLLSADVAFARRGADDPAGHVRQGRGADDPVGHDAADDRGGARAERARGRNGADDPADHDANDDRVTASAAARGVDNPPEVEVERPGDRQRGRGKN